MMDIILILLCTVVPYLIGSLNTSLIAGKIAGKEDIRTKGSGNAGMTNVLRNYGKAMAAIVFLGDGLKGALAVLLVRLYENDVTSPAMYVAAVFVVLGHIFPVFFGFRGGKGVATAVCALAALPNGLIVFAILIVTVIVLLCVTRIMSLSVLITTLTSTLWMLIIGRGSESLKLCVFYSVSATVILFITHRANIVRLIKGEENKLGSSKK